MGRLTHYDENGCIYSTRGYEMALSRLAAYEEHHHVTVDAELRGGTVRESFMVWEVTAV